MKNNYIENTFTDRAIQNLKRHLFIVNLECFEINHSDTMLTNI